MNEVVPMDHYTYLEQNSIHRYLMPGVPNRQGAAHYQTMAFLELGHVSGWLECARVYTAQLA